MVQPKNITKLNEHVDTFMCTRGGWDLGATPSLEGVPGMSTRTLHGSFRIAKDGLPSSEHRTVLGTQWVSDFC